MSEPVRVFYSYCHLDHELLHRLRAHLSVLRRRGLISEWYDQDIEAGRRWRDEISDELDSADLILLLVSADFVNSEFCYEQETKRALERADRGDATVVAVMLRPVGGWEDLPFAQLQAAPAGGRPVTSWPNEDEAFADVTSKITRVVERLRAEPSAPTSAPEPSAGPRRAESCEQLAAALGGLVAEGDGAFLIADVGGYYAQFLMDGQGIWCELVSNVNLDPGLALDEGQEARLAELGWSPPGENLPNWWWPAPQETSPDEIAGLVVDTLAEVYRVSFETPFELQQGR